MPNPKFEFEVFVGIYFKNDEKIHIFKNKKGSLLMFNVNFISLTIIKKNDPDIKIILKEMYNQEEKNRCNQNIFDLKEEDDIPYDKNEVDKQRPFDNNSGMFS